MIAHHGCWRLRAAVLVLAVFLMPSVSYAGGVGVSTPAAPTDSLTRAQGGALACCDTFNLYRLKRPFYPTPNTDLEFLWSETYRSRYNQPLADTTIENDLDRLGLALAQNVGNPYGIGAADIALLYNYFNWPGKPRPDSYIVGDDLRHHVVFGLTTALGPAYPEADDNHVDSYLFAPNTTWIGWHEIRGYTDDIGDGTHSDNAKYNYGLTNSDFVSRIEDISSGHPALSDSIYHSNSLMIPGPRRGEVGYVPWTVSGGRPNWMWDHEFQHALNPVSGNTKLRELWSSLAEAVGGELSDPPLYDVPYTWSLWHNDIYQDWRSFGSYLVSNFRNGTQQIDDDLVYRWAHGSGDKDLAALALRLRNGECTECQTLGYMAPDTTAIGRLALVMHNWRVAQYADNYNLAEHQYGFPDAFGFQPRRDVGVFQNINGDPSDDNISVPPEIVITTGYRADSVFRQRPPIHGSPARPLNLAMLGSEYFVFRSDPALATTAQDLMVRVSPDSIIRVREELWDPTLGCFPFVERDGELFASIITYSHDDTSLFRHPE